MHVPVSIRGVHAKDEYMLICSFLHMLPTVPAVCGYPAVSVVSRQGHLAVHTVVIVLTQSS